MFSLGCETPNEAPPSAYKAFDEVFPKQPDEIGRKVTITDLAGHSFPAMSLDCQGRLFTLYHENGSVETLSNAVLTYTMAFFESGVTQSTPDSCWAACLATVAQYYAICDNRFQEQVLIDYARRHRREQATVGFAMKALGESIFNGLSHTLGQTSGALRDIIGCNSNRITLSYRQIKCWKSVPVDALRLHFSRGQIALLGYDGHMYVVWGLAKLHSKDQAGYLIAFDPQRGHKDEMGMHRIYLSELIKSGDGFEIVYFLPSLTFTEWQQNTIWLEWY
jgi:hypothetical protein